MSEKFRGFIKFAKELVLGEKIETPEKLGNKLRREAKQIKEYIPYLSEEERSTPCNMIRLDQFYLTPGSGQVEDEEQRKKLDAKGYVVGALRVVLETTQAYIGDDKNAQTIRVKKAYNVFLKAYRESTMGGLVDLLDKLIEEIESIARL